MAGRTTNRGWLVAAALAVAVVALGVLLARERSGPADRGATTVTVTVAAAAGGTTTGDLGNDAGSGLAWIDAAALPSEARQTIQLIRDGGPFPYSKDGATFGNRERLLPQRTRGYYREYTVETPGSRDRGARRIVTGDGDREFFYTDDHYRSFRRVRT